MKPEFYPHHNPYGPDWPDANYHPDWPHHKHMHHWNDTEPAAVVPWHDECCPEPSDPCVCVTNSDVDLWNTISAVSAFSTIDIDGLSGLSALSGLSEMLPVVSAVNENMDIWMSAQYVPNIYEDISALSAKIDTKAPLSGEYLQRVYSDPYFFEGAGTMKSVLKPSFDLLNTVAFVISGTENFKYELVNKKECEQVFKLIGEHTNELVKQDWEIKTLNAEVDKIREKTDTNWVHQVVTLKESKAKPNLFYYYDSKNS